MDKKDLAYKVTQSAVSHCGVLLDDNVLTTAVVQLFDDYPVIGDEGTRGEWDWWGSVEAPLLEDTDKVSVSINVYGEERAGDGQWSMVAYVWGTDGCTNTKQLVGKASFYYHTSHAITCVVNQVDPVHVILDKLTKFSGVMCDPSWRKEVVRAIVEYEPKNMVPVKVPLNRVVSVRVGHVRGLVLSLFVWADDALVGSATVDAGIFWDNVLSLNRTDQ